ncbi:hypothetical protein U3A55_13230 [Salarchaeum sp. III]|uniref:hypothetical protein n=1 Tax=Salarchaeum sp. III TaxID=3107927 RepID=UPI002ED93E6F
MASVSASHVILFIAAVAVAVMLAGTATGVANDVSNAIRDTGDDYAETLDTDFAIISDPGSDAIYNASDTTVTLLVKNTGANVLSTNPDRVDTLIDGEFVQETTITVLDGDYWRPGNVARITLNTTIDNGAHRVIVRSNEQRSLLTFPFYGGGTATGEIVYAGSVNIFHADSGTITTYVSTENLTSSLIGLGPATDFDNDGTADIPYTTQNDELHIAYGNGTTRTILQTSYTDDDGTRLAVGSWNGSEQSILFGNDTAIYRVTPDGQVQNIYDKSARAIAGVADVNGDGLDELVFTSSSGSLQLLTQNGTIEASGSYPGNSNLNIGTPRDFDDDGYDEVPFVSGSGYINLAEYRDSQWTSTTDPLNNSDSYSPMNQRTLGTYDVDSDGDYEIVFVAPDDELAYMEASGPDRGIVRIFTNATGDSVTVTSPGVA